MAFLSSTWATLLTAALLVSSVASQEPDPRKQPGFLFPVSGEKAIYYMMDTVEVTYYSFYDTADLFTFCRPGVGQLIYQQKAPGFNATLQRPVPILLNFTSDTPCWFNVRTGPNGVDGANSETFNVIGEERSSGRQVFGLDSASSSSPSSTATPSSSISSSSTSSGSAAASTSSGNTPNASANPGASESTSSSEGPGGLSAGASAGIGIGVSLGVIAIAGGAFFIWWRRRHPRRTGAVELDGGGGNNNRPPPPGYGSAGVGQFHDEEVTQKWHYSRELDTINSPVEIATSNPATGDLGRTHHEMEA
ncbi:hypothetical protein C8A03DRAFT_36999 [Achaetomium macrosporum]|uniref:Mid2 domain-containing protein n=1 Tax=Achaetomium macrosporum TaxID=79813 RepID=A0AAN7C4D3_9PEZI|nr:hypothetical protein C8A03DRAFT_36999 [Achaetomium macrosporum]